MANPYAYNGSYSHYSPPQTESQMNTSLMYHNMPYVSGNGGSTLSSLSSSTTSSITSSYLLHNPRLRYYLSKLFDVEDDLEFCPEIPEYAGNSPTFKKFNPHTALVFSPTNFAAENTAVQPASQQDARVQTPRQKKVIEIVNPHTKVKVGSPASAK
ncbi:hypothetical protein METBIDRAFT_30460 [Metschnikowia bicuspidata var. bicuspidata NRRL YB-4993]|uniref:Uncharacterized protein n=1 Tax=Metschnikowia bicuspidata var. bicuspidata NRRL YB-4993 TaxID=869754 RepID=A0A1A0HJE1_9ASCO|nr:hypothetical protein METBIDRAFT_30460 [Metschnikowia bicuspidata var. bicuspidata NRRL YB-4993]OBA24116.1 hypothetical protein METBIDRAFT_30460 [Metschnikowia bicuspidata var. bicuspidata NRRL YB-4993]